MQPNTIPQAEDAFLFQNCLLENIREGAIFLDSNGCVKVWNKQLETMTGLSAKNVVNVAYSPTLLSLECLETLQPIAPERDPVIRCMTTRATVKDEFAIGGFNHQQARVEVTATPVVGTDGSNRGCVVLIHDASVQLNLQRQLKDLHEFSMLDPLTQVANRAVFERALDDAVYEKRNSNSNHCLIICDIDFFKQINDNYNHHVGDQTLIAFAQLLKQFERDGDVIARFGGEEFVVLCKNCDLPTAIGRAEEIRVQLTQTPMEMLDGKYITASFGVSELRVEDAATDFFVRADTALLEAKEQGRNRVIASEADAKAEIDNLPPVTGSAKNGIAWPELKGTPLASHQFRTRTPIPVLVEKLRGFIVETEAELKTVKADHASLTVEFEDPNDYARKGRFQVEFDFQEEDEGAQSEKHGRRTYTYMRITIRLAKRSWFSTNAPELAPDLLNEIRRFFMVNDESDEICEIKPATEYRERY